MIRRLFILWLQGWDQAPPLVRTCADTWIHHHPDWEVVLLDRYSLDRYLILSHYLNEEQQTSMSRNHLANFIRMILLLQHGGVWVDATVFCCRPLDDWLEGYVKEGFFAFRGPGEGRLLANWFLYSEKDGWMIKQWLQKSMEFWSDKVQCETYFWHHGLFASLCEESDEFRHQWQQVPTFECNDTGPHRLRNWGLVRKPTTTLRKEIHERTSPLYKLDWRVPYGNGEDTVINYLLSLRREVG